MIAPAEELSLEEKTDGFVTGVSVVFLMFIALFLEAFVTLLFWRWFVVSLGLKPLAYWHALGLVLFVGFIRHRADNEVPDGASPEVSERRRRLAATGKWPLRRPMRSDKQGYGASSEVLTS